MSADSETLEKIPEKKPIRVFLPIKEQTEMFRVHGVFEHLDTSKFHVLFNPGELPANIDQNQKAVVSIDMGGPTTSIETTIEQISEDQQVIVMSVEKLVDHEQMREFFRVDASIPVISKTFSDQSSAEEEHWLLHGESIDISGSGILATFDKEIPETKFISLEITLPPEITGKKQETIDIIAHKVRTHMTSENRYQVAFHFDQITDEDRDKIIGSCLVLQRKMLRLKVKVIND